MLPFEQFLVSISLGWAEFGVGFPMGGKLPLQPITLLLHQQTSPVACSHSCSTKFTHDFSKIFVCKSSTLLILSFFVFLVKGIHQVPTCNSLDIFQTNQTKRITMNIITGFFYLSRNWSIYFRAFCIL